MTEQARGLPNDPLSDQLVYQLRRAALSVVLDLTDRYAGLGLKLMDAVMLRFIEANPGCNQARIGNTLGIRRNNLVKIVNDLVLDGHVMRGQVDGRTYSLHLSDKGSDLVERIKLAECDTDTRFFGDMDDRERSSMNEFFVKLRNIALSTSKAPDKDQFTHLVCKD